MKRVSQGEPLYCCFQRRFRFALRRPHLFGAVSKGLLAVIDTLSQGEGTWQVLRQLLNPRLSERKPGRAVHKSIHSVPSPRNRPHWMPWALAFEGAGGLQHQVVAVARADDLHADGQLGA